MSKDLLPCPFCGEVPVFKGDSTERRDVELSLTCCVTMTNAIGGHRSRNMGDIEKEAELRQALTEQWNFRATPPAPAAQGVIPGEQERVDTGREVVVLGIPQDSGDWAEDDPRRHNCDAMGCGRAHVLARIPSGAAQSAEVQSECPDSDMMCWLAEDGEVFGHTPQELAEAVADDMEDGEEKVVTINCALALPDRKVRIKCSEGRASYQWIGYSIPHVPAEQRQPNAETPESRDLLIGIAPNVSLWRITFLPKGEAEVRLLDAKPKLDGMGSRQRSNTPAETSATASVAGLTKTPILGLSWSTQCETSQSGYNAKSHTFDNAAINFLTASRPTLKPLSPEKAWNLWNAAKLSWVSRDSQILSEHNETLLVAEFARLLFEEVQKGGA